MLLAGLGVQHVQQSLNLLLSDTNYNENHINRKLQAPFNIQCKRHHMLTCIRPVATKSVSINSVVWQLVVVRHHSVSLLLVCDAA